mgnify:CR=1 FL=1
MSKLQLTDSHLVDLLGGTSKVARMCNVAPAAVAQWKIRGIPHGHLLFLAARLEKESHGLVSRKELFPYNYDLIWPELK